MELENRVITKDYHRGDGKDYYHGDGILSHLIQQRDGRYTIVTGVWTTSGYDRWYTIESTNDTGALDIFTQFLNILYRPDIDDIDKQDLYSELDIYRIDECDLGYY